MARHWFLPESPDLLGMLDEQLAITTEGMDAFAAWASGDEHAGRHVRACEHRADDAKHRLAGALRDAFTSPIEPEDLYALSHGIDWVLNHAKDVIGESEVMACPPDAAVGDMARLLAHAVREVTEAIARLKVAPGDPVDAAEAAIKAERRVEKVYRRAMAALAAGVWGAV